MNIRLDVDHIVQWNSTACFKASKKMAEDYARKVNMKLTEAGPKHAIWFARKEDKTGAIEVIPELAQLARDYIDRCLEAGAPVIAGVSHKDANYNWDQITDHFVLIHGRIERETGGSLYIFLDPSTSRAQKNSSFELDKRGLLWRPGAIATGPVRLRRYACSCIRRWQEIQ